MLDGVRLIAGGGAQFGNKQNQKITKGQKVKRKTGRESLEKKTEFSSATTCYGRNGKAVLQ